MQLIQSIILAANACSIAHAFVPSRLNNAVGHTLVKPLQATEAERLLEKVRALREEVKADEDKLHLSLHQKKANQDAATDAIISNLFQTANDNETLCDRLRQKRLASDMLVRIVERLHEREVAAKGLEHVESEMSQTTKQVTFKRVAQEDEVELVRLEGLLEQLIEAAEVLDAEFISEKSKDDGAATRSHSMHFGGGNMAGIIKDKAKDLGREHDEQFLNRLDSFYEAVVKKHSKEDVDRSWSEEF